MTEPPETKTFFGQVSQYVIFMAYAENEEQLVKFKIFLNQVNSFDLNFQVLNKDAAKDQKEEHL